MMRRFLLLTLLLPLFCAGFGVGARAQGGYPCSFTVTTPFAFGQNVDLITDPTSSQAYNRNETAGQIKITCDNIPDGKTAHVCVSIPSDAPNARVMDWQTPPPSVNGRSSATNGKLYFDIYQDEARQQAWPTLLREVPTRDLDKNETKIINFYGKINPYQNLVSVGSYKGSFPVKFRVFLYNKRSEPVPACRGDGYGGTREKVVEVTATIKNMCKFTAPTADMVFPGQKIIKPTDIITAKTKINLTCTMDAPYWISLDNGKWKSGKYRRMKSNEGEYYIDYQLYTKDDYAVVWGVTQNVDTVPGEGKGENQPHDVYGKILLPEGSPSPRPGEYSDKIIVTVNF